jgi:hypothetical protein
MLFKNESVMDIEDIAKLDLYLRSQKGLQHILDIENLIIVDNDPNSVTKLKDAVHRLNEIDNTAPQEIKETWHNLFNKQVRYSVTRVKQKKKGSDTDSE